MSWITLFKSEPATQDAPARNQLVGVVMITACPEAPEGVHVFGSPHGETLVSKDAEKKNTLYIGVHQCVYCYGVLVVVDSTDGPKTMWEVGK